MTLKDKLILILLSIITLGIYPLSVFSKKQNSSKAVLSHKEAITVDLEQLRDFLGGTDNIEGAEYTHTKIKIIVNDKNKVNVEAIAKLKGVSGVFATSRFITLIVGNSAKAISEKLI